MPETLPLDALLHHAAFAPINNLAWLRVTGDDRVRWLNGMATNSIQALTAGQGCYNFFLNAQGRIQADAMAWMLEDAILLETADAPRLATLLDHFIIMDDVELAPEPRAGLLLAGPEAPAMLTRLGLQTPPALHLEQGRYQGEPLTILTVHAPLVPRFELWSDPATLGLLSESLRHAGCPEATPEALEHLRILEQTPLLGIDIRDKDLPQETNQDRALHFSKGCYLGQEIVERIRSRGQVHRTLQAFALSGELPAPGTILMANDKAVGELTSSADIPNYGLRALGYLRREALTASITYANGTATPIAPVRPA